MEKVQKVTNKNNSIWIYLILSIIVCGFLLSFHILTAEKTIVPKKSLTFQKTFITENDELDILKKIHFGSLHDKYELKNDELANTIKENWEVYKKENGFIYKHESGKIIIISYD